MIRRLVLALCLLPTLAWPCTGVDSYSRIACTDGASLYWRMDASSGTTETAFAGSTNGTYQNGFTLSQTGIPTLTDKAVAFSGAANTRMALAVGGSTIAGPSITNGVGWTAEGWVKFASVAGSQSPFSRYSAVGYQWFMYITGGAWFATIYATTGGAGANTINGSAVSTGTWYLFDLATVGNGTNIDLEFYINGVSQGSLSNKVIALNALLTSDLQVGDDGDNAYPTNGTEDEMVIYQTRLSTGLVLGHYNCGFAGTGCPAAPGSGGSTWPFTVKRPTLPHLRDDDFFTEMARLGYGTGDFAPSEKMPRFLNVGYLPFQVVPPGNVGRLRHH